MPLGRFLPMLRSRRARLGALSGAVVLTGSAVALGVLVPSDTPSPTTPVDSNAAGSLGAAAADLTAAEDRAIGTSRSTERAPAVAPRTPTVKRQLWTTEALKLRVQPEERSRDVGVVADDRRIDVTGKRSEGYAEVVVGDKARWVSAQYLSRTQEKEPVAPAQSDGQSDGGSDGGSDAETGSEAGTETGTQTGLDTSSCGNGAVASGGLQPQAQTVMNAVCNAFPEISTYGGYAPRGEHGGGMAIDVMVTGSTGDQVTDFLYANRGELGLSNVIWAQTIWSAQRDSEGFRGMEDRGSPTANHFDNVHVLVG